MTRQMPRPRGVNPPALPGGAAPIAAKIFTWQEIVGIIRRRFWLMFIVVSLCTLGGVGAYFLLKEFRPRYKSWATIECKMPIQENPLTGNPLIPHRDIIELETRNQALYLTNASFLSEVLTRTAVQDTAWFRQYGADAEKRLKKFRKHFWAQDQRNSNFVGLSMTCADPGEAKLILNEILDQFTLNITELTDGKLRDRLAALRSLKDGLTSSINRKNEDILGLLKKTNQPGFELGESRFWDEFKIMHNESMILDAEVNDAQLMLQNMQEEINTLGYSPALEIDVENNGRVVYLTNQIVDQESRLAQIQKRLGENHQQVKSLRASIAGLRDQLDQLRRQLLGQYSNMQLTSMERLIASKVAQRDTVKGNFEAAESSLQLLNDARINFMRSQTELEDLKTQLRLLDERINEVQIQLDDTDRVSVVVKTNPTTPLGLTSPRRLICFPIGFLLGLGLAVGLVFLLEFMDDSVKTPSDVRRYVNIPLLGMIPLHEEGSTDLPSIAKMAYEKPQALMSESFRQVRTNLSFSAPAEEIKSLLITSSSAGCGKTTVAVNLAITLAVEGKRILLVDANFRRAALKHLFGAEGSPRGLSNILVGQAPAAEAIRQTEVEGLDVIDAGPKPPNPSVLLSSARMKDFLEGQKQYYDHIIVDGPPTLIVTDARIIAGQVDGTIAVVHAGNTSRGVVQRMISELKNNKVHILGILLNSVQALKGGYFRESYRSYYDYTATEARPQAALPAKAGGKKANK